MAKSPTGKVRTYRVTIGTKTGRTGFNGKEFIKWHHFTVQAKSFEEGLEHGREAYEAQIGNLSDAVPFLVIEYQDGIQKRGWKKSYNGWDELSQADLERNLSDWKDRQREKFENGKKLHETANASLARLTNQSYALLEAAKVLLGAAQANQDNTGAFVPDYALDGLEKAVRECTFD